MAKKKYRVTLTETERERLTAIVNRGKHSAQKRKRAQALLLAGRGYTDEAIAERAGMHRRGIEGSRQRFAGDGVTLEGKERGRRQRSIRGKDEARLIAPACGPVPEGYARRTLRLLRDKRTTPGYTGTKEVPHETIRRTLKKNELKPRRQKEWCIAPGHNAEFAAGMEDVPGVYARERDGKRPLVCTGECPKQPIGETGGGRYRPSRAGGVF